MSEGGGHSSGVMSWCCHSSMLKLELSYGPPLILSGLLLARKTTKKMQCWDSFQHVWRCDYSTFTFWGKHRRSKKTNLPRSSICPDRINWIGKELPWQRTLWLRSSKWVLPLSGLPRWWGDGILYKEDWYQKRQLAWLWAAHYGGGLKMSMTPFIQCLLDRWHSGIWRWRQRWWSPPSWHAQCPV